MDILYLLIPLSVVLVLAVVGVFAWALYNDQFEDLEREGERLLQDSDAPAPAGPALDPRQGRPGAAAEESRPSE